MYQGNYIMDSAEEILRLDMKTDLAVLEKQVGWAGLSPGMAVGDMGCGPGKTTMHLGYLTGPSGTVTGVDIAPDRLAWARSHYLAPGISYVQADLRQPPDILGPFDFIFLRFVLEFYSQDAFDMVQKLSCLLKPGGIFCIVDLDHNCLNHYGIDPRLEGAIQGVMESLGRKTGFDPRAGRKLYAHLFDLGFEDIAVKVSGHHMIYGDITDSEAFNWAKKIEAAAKHSSYAFDGFEDGFEGFKAAAASFFTDPRRFTYTPIICCKGRKPK
ncbi:methyltransferase domain-containing protein [uncultured Desulfobacter sp.]|uniref:class I SAM-dependent methyltransferase n=1 Tax=uncultured Desulfobacter sp. TaxID=240139 RepID=UPI002AAAA511|nr:methyltransferase domain-containing protein [uncultured Desulfobacter sp.]